MALDHEHGEEVLRQVAPLARAANAQVEVMTVLDTESFRDTVTHPSGSLPRLWAPVGLSGEYVKIPESPDRMVEYGSDAARAAHDDALAVLEDIAHEHLIGLEVRFLVEESEEIATEIVGAAQKVKADLIAIGGHRSSWFEAMMRNVTRSVLEQSPLPVIVIPPAKR